MSQNDPIGLILLHEGGYVDHPNDKGGATNFGITQNTLTGWRGYPVSKDEVRNMLVEEARDIYEVRYLKEPGIDKIIDPPQTLVLDMSINHGPRRSVKILQKTINLVGEFGIVDVDGRLGPQTRGVVNNAAEVMGPYLQNALVEERIKFYHAIVNNNPSQKVFLKGWLRRANSFILPV